MSLPSYLARIKSSGVYRFVWDKSQLPPQTAETLRMVVGYSEKGPFNAPVYIDNVADFKSIFGNGSKRLEKRGVFFHRMAQQALSAGPILALNLKPFDVEEVSYASFNGEDADLSIDKVKVKDLYDINRFWKLDEDQLPSKLNESGYFHIATTDTKEKSCSIFIRKTDKKYLKQYEGITLREWYNGQSLEYPEYLESVLDEHLDEYFMDVYVFRGKFTEKICEDVFHKYFEGTTLEKTISDSFGRELDALEELAKESNSNFIASYRGCTIPYFKDANGNYISIDLKVNADYSSHQLLMKLNEDLLEESVDSMKLGEGFTGTTPYYMEGYTYESIEKTDNIYDKSIGMLTDRGIYTAMTNRVDVEYHYLVDTFGRDGIDTTKSPFFELAKAKDNAFAIVNFPAIADMAEGKAVDMEEIVNGYAMPGESEGASWGAYYTQLIFSDGTVKNTVPSAALVSNLFMEKWGPRKPYYIVAGPIYGQLSYSGLVGPDYNYGRDDLDILEPKGINAIIYVPRQGIYINSNQTAKQRPVSGLSKIHIRELVIYLQNEIENLLQSYQWELNTQALRDVIKAKADVICENIQQNGGLYAFTNVCDATNNTPEVIDNEMIILDTEIEPARGAGKMVHQLTIHKTGGLSSSVR